MPVTVFAGPSLGRRQAGVDHRGPAACGDVARAVAEGSRVIGLIDGLFETTLPPWHKELLWAMSQGAAVFGAASMGALRAVELAPFGMVGVGAVFEAYRDGVLTDDDEVALLHGPAELGYPALTEPMVNIRWTVEAAARHGVLTGEEAGLVVRCAKEVFYKERDWTAVWDAAGRAGMPSGRVAAASEATVRHRIDIKRRDADALLAVLADAVPGPRRPFVETLFWRHMHDRLRTTPAIPPPS